MSLEEYALHAQESKPAPVPSGDTSRGLSRLLVGWRQAVLPNSRE